MAASAWPCGASAAGSLAENPGVHPGPVQHGRPRRGLPRLSSRPKACSRAGTRDPAGAAGRPPSTARPAAGGEQVDRIIREDVHAGEPVRRQSARVTAAAGDRGAQRRGPQRVAGRAVRRRRRRRPRRRSVARPASAPSPEQAVPVGEGRIGAGPARSHCAPGPDRHCAVRPGSPGPVRCPAYSHRGGAGFAGGGLSESGSGRRMSALDRHPTPSARLRAATPRWWAVQLVGVQRGPRGREIAGCGVHQRRGGTDRGIRGSRPARRKFGGVGGVAVVHCHAGSDPNSRGPVTGLRRAQECVAKRCGRGTFTAEGQRVSSSGRVRTHPHPPPRYQRVGRSWRRRRDRVASAPAGRRGCRVRPVQCQLIGQRRCLWWVRRRAVSTLWWRPAPG